MLAVRLEENPHVRTDRIRKRTPGQVGSKIALVLIVHFQQIPSLARSLAFAFARTRKRYDMYPVCGQIDSACPPPERLS